MGANLETSISSLASLAQRLMQEDFRVTIGSQTNNRARSPRLSRRMDLQGQRGASLHTAAGPGRVGPEPLEEACRHGNGRPTRLCSVPEETLEPSGLNTDVLHVCG